MYVNASGYVGVPKAREDFLTSDILHSLSRFPCDSKFDNHFPHIEYIK